MGESQYSLLIIPLPLIKQHYEYKAKIKQEPQEILRRYLPIVKQDGLLA
jgi:hypothetical protein